MASEVVQEERFVFTSVARNRILMMGVAGLVLFAIGVFMAMSGGGHEEGHASVAATEQMVASVDQHAEQPAEGGGEHHAGTATWLKRIYASLWQNNVFFAGLGIIGLFFIAVQYAAQAGWSAGVKRIPLAMATWIPISGVLMLIIYFVASHDLFHWTHSYLYEEGAEFDPILNGKAGYFFWPLPAGGFPIFWLLRLVLFFGLWYMFYLWIRREMLAEDVEGGVNHWVKARTLSAVFLIIFAVSSSVSAWDWVMSIEPHWFSTMMGWYVFASWWVTGLATITLAVALLKEAGYLKVVNANHLHDLGKFVFAFSIFWTYIWFSQFMLIYYANIPEETVYFIARMRTAPYSWIFFLNLIMNFFLPFLLFMTRDAKRHISTLKLICPIVIIGHWFDFFNMITPGVMKTEGAFGLLEIGLGLVFAAAFMLVMFNALTKFPLVPKHDPMMGEALNHHI